MKSWSVNKLHCYIFVGMFLVAQLIAIAHAPAHTLELIQAAYGISDDGSLAQESCSICLAADYLDNGNVESLSNALSYSPTPLVVNDIINEGCLSLYSLYLARAPPVFS